MPSLRPLPVVVTLASALAAQNGLWASLSFPSSPGARYGAVMVHDSARDRLVLVGGRPSVGSGALTETWEHDGAMWSLRTSSGPSGSSIWYPSPFLAAAYDTQRQRTVVVQTDASSGNTKTWEWNGASWQLRTNGAVPPGRASFALAYDAVRGRTVLFGGYTGNGHFSDTWEWDGTGWLQRASGGPAPRQLHAMAFDAQRGKTVLFGGRFDGSNQVTFADTWEWNGSYWFEHFGVGGPAGRQEHAMAYDSTRGVTVLYGGRNAVGAGAATYTDTWEWNGAQWTNRQAGTPSSTFVALAHDALRQRTMQFGGLGPSGQVGGGTWAYAVPAQVASVVAYGAGCAGPTGVPVLAPQAGSVPRLGATLQLQLFNLPTGPLNVPVGWLGFDNTQWGGLPLPLALDPLGFPGCTALLAPASAYTLSNVAGGASWPLAIPFLPAFSGLQFYVQGGVLVLGFNPGGLVFTQALAATVGR